MPALGAHGGSSLTLAIPAMGAALLVLSGCGRSVQDDRMRWAQTALERNDRLELVATDQESGAFTVRIKETGELRMVRADEVMADLPAIPGAASRSASVERETSDPAPDAVSEADPSDEASLTSDEVASTPAGSSEESVESESPRRVAADSPSDRQEESEAASQPPVAGGQRVIASGPGYTITAPAAGARDTSRDSGQSGAAEVQRVALSSSPGHNAALERRSEPLVCQGSRFLRIDNRNIEFGGDAVTAEQGCELHITNSRIVARGTGLTVRGARVHIRNSSIAGGSASVEASDGAQVYAQYSTFQGSPRWLDSATLHDLGDNTWR